MTFAISVEFLHGSFRGDPEGAANTGLANRGEWPPAPFRLFAAFVAADGTGERCRVTDGSELAWLERLPPPTVHASPESRLWRQSLEARYVVEHKGSAVKSTTQEYAGRKSALIRPGVRVTPRDPKVLYVWNVEPESSVLKGLRRRAARIGYLGAADSTVRVRTLCGTVPDASTEDAYVPAPTGDLVSTVPAPGDVELLDRMYAAWVERGPLVGRAQFPALRHEVQYRSPGPAPAAETGVVVAWLRLNRPVPGRRIATITDLFKKAVLKKYDDLYGEPPAVLHGHGFRRRGYDLARFLALPDVGFRWSRGRIHGLALWLPPGTPPRESSCARDAALAIRRLVGPGIDVAVVPRDSMDHVAAASPGRWCRSACRWATAFPALHERRGPVNLEEVRCWCSHAGLPAPIAARVARGPFVPAGVDLAPPEVNRSGRPKLPYSHVELLFAEPVSGPVVIGAGRQRGLGLCVPVTGHREDQPL